MALAAAWACGNTGRVAGGWRQLHLVDATRSPYAGGRREGGWVAWRTVPTFVAGVLATLAGALLVRFRGPARADSAVTDRVVRWWAAVWLRAAGARVVVDGLEHVEPAATYVVVSNHQSNLDPMAQLRALPLSLRVLAMRELFRIPLLGRAMRIAGMIEVDRIPPTSARSTMLPPGLWRPGTRCWSIRRVRPHRMARSVTSKTAPSSSRSPARCRSCRLPSMAPAGSGHRGDAPFTAARCVSSWEAPCLASRLTHHDIAGLREQARDVICSAHRDLVEAMSAKAVS